MPIINRTDCCLTSAAQRTWSAVFLFAFNSYQKGNTNIKPPDLWIHHDQMELKALEKGHSGTDGASSSGAMTLPRSVGANDYDTHDSQPSNSLDKRNYIPSYMGEF